MSTISSLYQICSGLEIHIDIFVMLIIFLPCLKSVNSCIWKFQQKHKNTPKNSDFYFLFHVDTLLFVWVYPGICHQEYAWTTCILVEIIQIWHTGIIFYKWTPGVEFG